MTREELRSYKEIYKRKKTKTILQTLGQKRFIKAVTRDSNLKKEFDAYIKVLEEILKERRKDDKRRIKS